MGKITTPKETETEHLQMLDSPLEEHLELFHEVRGYRASAFTTYKGDVIAFDSLDERINTSKMGQFFCEMFNYTDQEISKKGFIGCAEMQMLLGDNLFLIFSSGDFSLITTRLVILLEKDGNYSLAKMNAGKVVKSLMNTITWSTDNYLLPT